MKKSLYISAFIILYGLVTFFGLGPVLLADGSFGERAITLGFVLVVYGIITYFFWLILRKHKR